MVKKGYKQTEVGIVPKEWSVMTLRDIADFLGGGTPSKSIAEYWNGDIPWISSSDISLNSVHGLNITRYITGQAVKESSTQLCPRNAILIVTRVGVGKIAIAPTNICTSQDFTNIVLRQDNVEYVARALQPVFYCMSNETQGTSIKGVTTDEVKNTSIALPPIKEQEQIATVLSEIDELISLTEKQISKKKAIKQGAMQELLTGKRRLPGFSGEWETRTLHPEIFSFAPTILAQLLTFLPACFARPACGSRKNPRAVRLLDFFDRGACSASLHPPPDLRPAPPLFPRKKPAPGADFSFWSE